MKIGRIDSIRCGEPSASTYVIVPDELTQEEFEGAVSRARRAYETVMAETPLSSRSFPYFPSMRDFQDMPPERTIGDVFREVEEIEQERKKAQAQAERRRRSFGFYLEQEGLPPVQRSKTTFNTKVDWGHKHGQKIRYDGLEFFSDDPYEDLRDEGNEQCGKEADL